jgi:uncharacterized DUF497 family protein
MSRYTWDREKAEANRRKHGVTFEEAETVDLDPYRRILPDPDHDREDARFLMTGYTTQQKLLVVVTSERGPRPRIISARRASKRERYAYEARP